MRDAFLIAISPLLAMVASVIITCAGGAIKGALQSHKHYEQKRDVHS